MWGMTPFTNYGLLKVNSEKFHLFVSASEKRHLNVEEIEISKSKCEILLGIKIDSKLMFDSMWIRCAKKLVKNWTYLRELTIS